MKDYNVCKDINDYYFRSYASISLIIPKFFDEFSEEDNAIKELKQLLEKEQFEQVIGQAENYLKVFPDYSQHAFLALQVFAMWQQGKIPNSELLVYFDNLEEILPKDPAINFDKAALYVREKKFNEAVKELNIARKKDPEHTRSVMLQFWIYYFSRDDQWRSLFKIIQKNKILIDSVIAIVNIVEAINDKIQTPLYLSGDELNPQESNKFFFTKFPEMVIGKAPTEENVVFTAADGGYFREYVVTFLLSALTLRDRNFGIHVHLYNPMGTDLELLQLYDQKYPELKISYSYEKASLSINTEALAYYASMRFARAHQIFEKAPLAKKIAIMDADMIIRKNPFLLEDIKDSDVSLTSSHPITPSWEKFAAVFSCFAKTPAAQKAFAYLANVILQSFAAQREFWFIDQVALFDMHKKFSRNAKFVTVPLDKLLGKDMQHTDEALLWTYTNEHKTKDNPMNQERRHLFEKYGVQPDWNQFARGKYGTILANRNDEYIGRNLLAIGSWCDHEIKFMRMLIEFGDTVLEVGSNMGSHTLPLAKAIGNHGKLIAIEPQRLLFQTVCAQIAMNSLQNVYPMNVAVGEEEGVLSVSELDPTQTQNFGGYQPKENKGDHKVPIITIDSLEMTSCKLLKMDIEGMELEALKGAEKTLETLQPILFFESHGEAVFEIADFLKKFGYTVYDFAIPNDPMFLGVTEKYPDAPGIFNIKPIQR